MAAATVNALLLMALDPGREAAARLSESDVILASPRLYDVFMAEEIFSTLMGDQVEPRRDFIYTNAQYASNLDV